MLQGISIRLFGGLVEPYMSYFEGLGNNLKRGTISSTTHEYV